MENSMLDCEFCGGAEFCLERDTDGETIWVVCRNCDFCMGSLSDYIASEKVV